MGDQHIDDLAATFHRLEETTARIARAAGELQAAGSTLERIDRAMHSELEALTDRLRALQLELANETERAWNRAEAAAQQARRARMMGRVHDATTPEAPIVGRLDPEIWRPVGPVRDPSSEE